MIINVLQKVCYYVSLFLGIIFFSFILFHTIPSDPARTILGPNASQQQVEQLRVELGLDRPLLVQFTEYIVKAATLEFGNSYVDGRVVSQEVLKRMGISLTIIALATFFILLYLVTVTFSSHFLLLKKCLDLVDFIFSSQPIFFSGIVVSLLTLYLYPITTFSGTLTNFNDLLFLLPPAFVTAMYPMAILSGILKKELLLSQRAGYITAARAMGWGELNLTYKHSIKNCLIPVLSAFSNILPSLLTGIFIIEIIFSLPGIGSLLLHSILRRDFPMLECTIIVNGAFFIFVNFIFEILYPFIDPRITGAGSSVSI